MSNMIKLSCLCLSFLLLLALASACSSGSTGQTRNKASSSKSSSSYSFSGQSQANEENTVSYISEDEAKEAATNSVGLSVDDVTFDNVKLDIADEAVYSISFYGNSRYYSCNVNASSKEVTDMKNEEVENSPLDSQGSNSSTQPNGYIGEEKAKSIALSRVKGSNDSDIVIRLNTDDVIPFYEGTVYYGRVGYTFKINAQNGEIINWDTEAIN